MRIVVRDRRYATGRHYTFDENLDYSRLSDTIQLTDKVRRHYRKNKSSLNYATFRGLAIQDIMSILSAVKRQEAKVNVDRWGNCAYYKLLYD